jgi:pimeloyl-ACP methyl ester carboxylesterase
LTDSFDKAGLAVEVLKDGDATRENVIRQFRSHLGKARDGDVALFQYCGHGARWASAREFREFYPDGKDEGLVCIDSRRPGGFDLADKELAVLISEVARNNPHLAVVLDCCHSGSGTRGVDAFRGLTPRVTHEVTSERPLASYLDGHYATLRNGGQPLFIPTSRHILLAACERTQLAQEAPDRSGVFTSTLVEVLGKSGSDLTYSDLFVRCRAAVRSRADNQNPQFEAYGHFNSSSGFLDRPVSQTARRFSTYFDQGAWTVECGAIHGVPTDPEKTVALALYPEDDQTRLAGTAAVLQVGAQKSEVKPGFPADESVRYRAEITSLPVPPMPVHVKGDAAARDALDKVLAHDGSVNVALTDVELAARYALIVEDVHLFLKQRETDLVIQGAAIDDGKLEDAATLLLPVLKTVAQWERSLSLQNLGTLMDPSLVDFVFAERLDDGREHVYPAGEIILDYLKAGGQWQGIRGKLKARNRTKQPLNVVVVYFSRQYGISTLCNEPLEPGDDYMTLWDTDPDQVLELGSDVNESVDVFKLIVSTEQVDAFLLEQDPIELGGMATRQRDIGARASRSRKIHRNEWFTKDLRIKIVRRLDQVGANDAPLAKGKVVVKGHPSITANLSLSAAKSPTRGGGAGSDFYKAFERQGLELLNFAGTRGGNESILELTDIQNAASLKENPLEIEVNVPLGADEGILAVVHDGQHVLLGGDTYKDDEGRTHVSIDHIPDVPDHRRSLGGSLKLYFFKTYLKHAAVNKLRWVEFKPDGSFAYQASMVADKVAAARNILLLVHGIIGDTEGMAKGVQACGLDRKFDLVLTYDYENLSTPIADTAQELKSQLASAGLHEGDDKRLTLLVHSMGGLVSRWFIERLGGNKIVDHLVMCGTPNHGSPFGKINEARRILGMLTGLSMNYLPVFIPFSGAVLLALNRSKKLTPTLEQMNPASEFIQALNASDDPGIPYTILAGDVEKYQEPSDGFFATMLAKTGRSVAFEALFAAQPNDIAVGVESILGIDRRRSIPPVASNVACHHLNYFVSDAGQHALTAVQW